MEALIGSERLGKVILLSVVLLLVGAIVGGVRAITGSYIVGVMVLLGLVWWLLREVGSYVMYPGSFFLTRSDIEMRYSREIGARMVACFNAIHALSVCVAHRKYFSFENRTDFVVAIDRHIRSMTAMLEMFQNTLSPRKTALLHNYRHLRDCLEAKGEQEVSISTLIANPRLIGSLQQSFLPFYRQRFAEITDILKEMVESLKSFAPPTGTVELMRYRMSEENLYEMRFGFYNWMVLFNFELFSIHSTEKAHIESAIIHHAKQRREELQIPNNSTKAVLFCNPNGVFIQFFASDNEYVINYLKMGYHVILWNYRGYGQSTGTPSIRRSQEDALAVYRFYRNRGYEIEIVHGYSIGGAAAVGLMERLSKGQQQPGDKVEVLIVDRSFSSIGEMSSEFGKTIHNLTRMIFFADNIDLSKQFEAVSCRKLLVWDYCDEVIPDKASVKNRIIKRKKQGKKGKVAAEEDRIQLSEEVITEFPQDHVQFEEVARQLHWTVDRMLEMRKNSDNSDKELNNIFDEREASSSTAGALQDNSFEALMRMIGRVDGGGIELFHNISQLEEIRTKNPEYFQHICESYVLGLVCYGSYFPLRPIVHNHARIKANTLAKIDHLLQQLGVPPAFNNSSNISVSQIHSNFASIFQRLRQMVDECFGEEWFQLHGSLLPTNNGHNSPLTHAQFEVLNEFINSSLGRREEAGKMKEDPQAGMI